MLKRTTAKRAPAEAGRGKARARARELGEGEVKGTIYVAAFRHAASILEAAGHDPRPLLVEAGAGDVDFSGPDQRISMSAYVALWRIAGRRFSAGSFGLSVGRTFELDHGNLFTYMAAHSDTLGGAVERGERYRDLVHELLLPSLRVEGDRAHLWQALSPAASRIGALEEAIVATWLKSFNLYTGMEVWPREIWFQQAVPRDLRPFDEAFRCPVRFGKPETRLIVERAVLEQPLRLANPRLRTYLEDQTQLQLSRLPRENRLADRVRRFLVEELRGGDPSQERIARRVALSPRTLQRRLKEEGVVFNDLLDEQRRVLCERYLQDQSLSGQEIACLLGYHERSSFYRAVRRWTGRTPQELRGEGLCGETVSRLSR
ncbi:Transcriptional regulator, AraC family protein [Minicystis rosea]|nr:Transcriptional regulator, AraC family protein [Minicystis rosea]